VVKGINGYDQKQRRRIRRQSRVENKIARALRSPIFRQRRIETNKEEKYKNYYEEDE
jgi:hypothetical protein